MPKNDEVAVWLQKSDGAMKWLTLRKGKDLTIPTYVRSLTNSYDLDTMYWELVECFRKTELVLLTTYYLLLTITDYLLHITAYSYLLLITTYYFAGRSCLLGSRSS